MKATWRVLLATSLLIAPAALATKIPIPVEGASLNVSVQVQTQALVTENGAPNGSDPAFDIFVRRTRILVNGDISQNFSYLIQVDNANFGKFGNFTGRAIVQDAWIGWAPMGITGGNVVYIDAGILLVPISRQLIDSTTNYITADTQADGFRFPGAAFPALRETGLQLRGWLFDKKVGFRGGVYEGGYAPIAAGTAAPGCVTATTNTCITPKRYPAVGGLVNLDIIGSEEGGWLYGTYKWAKDPVFSVNVSGHYQSQALRNFAGSLTDQKLLGIGTYLDLPMTEAAELVFEGTLYLNGNGSNSANTGTGLSAALGYRFGPVAPYVAFDYFNADDCDQSSGLTTAQLNTCRAGGAGAPHSVDSRNWKAGLNFFFNKNLNHLNLEFGVNHGQSAYGPQSITVANAGYAPLGSSNSLRVSSQKSFLAHWNVLF